MIEDLQEYATAVNVAELLDQEYLDKLGMRVVEEYDIDEQSRSDWKQRQEDASKLAAQLAEDKSFPWPGASNVKYPLLTEAALQFNARAYPALVPGTDIVKSRTVGFDPDGAKLDSAIRVSKHMSYQLLEEMEEWEEEMDKLLMALPIVGCMFKKTYYDPIKRRNRSQVIFPEDFVVNYGTTSLDDCFRMTHIIPAYNRDIQVMVTNGIYSKVDLSEATQQMKAVRDEVLGMKQPKQNVATQRTLLEQHRWEDLDGDGVDEPYVITVDKDSGKVLRIVAAYDMSMVHAGIDDEIGYVERESYFTKYGMIPNPDGGFYDIGFGTILSPVNKVVDTLINQMIDSGTVNNLQSGFLSRSVRMRKGETRLRPGEWKTLNITGDDLRKGIVPLPTKDPSNVLFQLLGMMVNAGQRLASTVDSMVGENPGQNQKATTTLAVIEQGSKVFSGIYKRLHRSFKQELRKLFKLNSQYVQAEDYFTVLDLPMPFENVEVIRAEDYNIENINVVPAADSSVSTAQQKMMKAQALVEYQMQTGQLNMQEVTRRYLEATEQPSIDLLMQLPPPQPTVEQQEFQHKQQLDWANFQLDVIQTELDDLKVRADAINKLADAEAKEAGTQLDAYTAQMNAIREEANDIDTRIKEMSAQESESGGTE